MKSYHKLTVIILIHFYLFQVPAAASVQELPEWRVANIAHRGGIIPGFPENTLTAFIHAISLGVDAIELDLRGSKDGEIIILHDETLGRTTNGSGKVTDFLLKDLKQLDAGNGEKIPTLEEVLEVISGTNVKLLLDIKVSPVLDKRKVVRMIEKKKAELDVIVGVRSIDDLKEFRKLNPNIRTLGFIDSINEIEEFISAGIDIIRLWPEWIHKNGDLVQRVHQLGKPVWITTSVIEPAEIKALIHFGINGIISDTPEQLIKIIGDK